MMNAARSGGYQHQRQYTSEQLAVDSASSSGSGRWLGAGGAPASQAEYSRMIRSMQRGSSGDFFLQGEMPATPPPGSRNQRKNADELYSSVLSPGILDLHSFDTELLPDMPVPVVGDGVAQFGYARERSFDDMKTSKALGVPDNSVVKSFSADKEKAGGVAKIKVVVRKRPLNKRETSKKEEDIIETEPNCNSLTVYETKLKVDLTEYIEKHEFVFDAVLDEDVSNDEVYRETVEPVVPAIFQRTKATCFAYGQTGKILSI